MSCLINVTADADSALRYGAGGIGDDDDDANFPDALLVGNTFPGRTNIGNRWSSCTTAIILLSSSGPPPPPELRVP